MAKYRKTALVEAEQFLPPHQIPAGCYQKGTMGDVASGHGEWFLKTREGEHPLRYADYICIGIEGERWNVERPIFEATYEVADTATPTAPNDDLRAVDEAYNACVWIARNFADEVNEDGVIVHNRAARSAGNEIAHRICKARAALGERKAGGGEACHD